MNRVTDYLEYRFFLRDFYEAQKARSPIISYRYIGRKVGIDPSHLVKIFQGKRHIGESSIAQFALFCKLSDRDTEYFETLVKFNKARSDREIKRWYERLLAIRGVKAHALGANEYEYYQKWYYTAVLMLLEVHPFAGDYRELAERLSPPISVREARKAVSLLTKLDLVRKRADGAYELTHRIVTTGEKCRPVAVRAFQEETIRLAAESLERHAKEERNISTVTITIRKDDLAEIDDIIKEFRAKLLQYAEQVADPDSVYQLNVQLFPLAGGRS